MKKIVYIPLDERPCNYNFPINIGEISDDYTVVAPPKSILGNKKEKADILKLWDWLETEIVDATGAILSIDTLVYGGILPSRLHNMSIEEVNNILGRLEKVKKLNENIPIYTFNLIMRCPQYSSSDEEPDYYEHYGREIFRSNYIKHKIELGVSTSEEEEELKEIEVKIPKEILEDYINRREINREVNKLAMDLVKKDIIDFMIIPQDDSSPYGLTALDQQYVRKYLEENNLETKVFMYPGADEVGCTLLGRMINHLNNDCPRVYVYYSSTEGPTVIPPYEDRMLNETIKYHILSQNGIRVTSMEEADIVLLLNSPIKSEDHLNNLSSDMQALAVERNLNELVFLAEYLINTKKKSVVIGDVAYVNEGDLKLLKLLRQKKLLYKLHGYAGWNTSSNTLGTCIAQGMVAHKYGINKKHLDFLALRFLEDFGYCGYVRRKICDNVTIPKGYNWFLIDGVRGPIVEEMHKELERFAENNVNYDEYSIVIEDIYSPWNRMFEIGLDVAVK